MKKLKKSYILIAAAVLFFVAAACIFYFMVFKGKTPARSEVLDREVSIPEADSTPRAEINLAQDGSRISGSGARVDGNKIYISQAGTYLISGTLEDGQICVDAGSSDTVILQLKDMHVANLSEEALCVNEAGQVSVHLVEKTQNSIQSGEKIDITKSEVDDAAKRAAVYSCSDLSVTGTGVLEVCGYINNGIQTKKNFLADSGTVTVEALNHGIKGEDSVRILGGSFSVASGGDGIKSDNTGEEDCGNIMIAGGNFLVESGTDALQAENALEISGGEFDIKAGGGSADVSYPAESGMGHFGGNGGKFGVKREDGSGDFKADGSRPRGNPPSHEERDGSGMPPSAGEADASPMPSPAGQGSDGETFEEWETNWDMSDESDTSKKGVKAGNRMVISGGKFSVDSYDDSFHCNGNITISGGGFSIASGDDGVHADAELCIDGGTLKVTKSYEGLEGNQITIDKADLDIVSADDGLNACGGQDRRGGGSDAESGEMPELTILGGTILVDAGGDGLDSNGDLTVEGGTVIVNGPVGNGNGAIDSGSENGGKCTISGGTVLALGSSGMTETFSEESAQCSFMHNFASSYAEGSEIVISDSSGKTIYQYTAVKEGASVVFSCPELKKGETYTLAVDKQEQKITLDSSSTTTGNVRSGRRLH